MNAIDRKMFAAAQPCRFECVYCFAKFPRFALENPLPRFSADNLREDGVIYPTFYGEFFSDHQAMAELECLVDSGRSSIAVSISVKSRIRKTHMHLLRKLNEQLNSDRRGLIKCSVSLSAKHHLEVYEPKTPTLGSVDWRPYRPKWEYCEVPLQMAQVRKSITENERRVFDTDLLVMEYLSSYGCPSDVGADDRISSSREAQSSKGA